MGATVVGKPAATVMTSSPRSDSSVSQFRRSQGHEGEQVGGRTGVDQGAMLHPKKVGEFLFKPFRITAGGQPEIERRVDQIGDLLLVKYSSCIGYAITGVEGFCSLCLNS